MMKSVAWTSVCFWVHARKRGRLMWKARRRSFMKHSEASSFPNCMMKDGETERTHTHTHTRQEPACLPDMWWIHAIPQPELNLLHAPASFIFIQIKAGNSSKLVPSSGCGSMPAAGRQRRCAAACCMPTRARFMFSKAITISRPWKRSCFLLMKAVFPFLISFSQLWELKCNN